jgi:hypothetical protein
MNNSNPSMSISGVGTSHDTSEFIFLDRERFISPLHNDDFGGSGSANSDPSPRNLMDILANMRMSCRVPVTPASSDPNAFKDFFIDDLSHGGAADCTIDVCDGSLARGIPESMEEAMFSNVSIDADDIKIRGTYVLYQDFLLFDSYNDFHAL